jgi:hypothetical protein
MNEIGKVGVGWSFDDEWRIGTDNFPAFCQLICVFVQFTKDAYAAMRQS